MDFISNIGNKRNSRKTSSRRPYTRRTSISSVSSLSSANLSGTSLNLKKEKKEKTLQALNRLETVQPKTDTPDSSRKPANLWINTSDLYGLNGETKLVEEEDLFTEVVKQLDLSAEQAVSLSNEKRPSTPSSKPGSKRPSKTKVGAGSNSSSTGTTVNNTKRISSNPPTSYVRMLKQKQKNIPYDLILQISHFIRNSDSWLERFIEDGGMQIIAKELGFIHKKKIRTQSDHKIELEILKCLNTLMNKKSGLQEAFKHARIIDNFCISLVSPYIPARTQACESLTAFCFLPNGRAMVLRGMELLKQYGPNFGRFDAWMQALEKTLDGRGKMGSAVGASSDLKMTGMVGAGDSQITQYMFISVLFINTLVRPDIVEDRKERIMLSLELEQAGIKKVFQKMESLNHEHISLAIQKFQDEIEADTIQEDMEVYYSLDPLNVLEMLLAKTDDTPAYQSLHNILCYLLKIQDSPEKSNYQFQLIEMLVQQVALDQSNYYPDDISSVSEFTVHNLIPKFSNASTDGEEQDSNAKPKLETDDPDDAVATLEAKVDYLEKELGLSKQTNAMLKIFFKSTEERYKSELLDTETKMRKLHDSVRNLTEYGNPSPKRRSFKSLPPSQQGQQAQQQSQPQQQPLTRRSTVTTATPATLATKKKPASENPLRNSWTASASDTASSKPATAPPATASQASARMKSAVLARRTSNELVTSGTAIATAAALRVKSRGNSVDSTASSTGSHCSANSTLPSGLQQKRRSITKSASLTSSRKNSRSSSVGSSSKEKEVAQTATAVTQRSRRSINEGAAPEETRRKSRTPSSSSATACKQQSQHVSKEIKTTRKSSLPAFTVLVDGELSASPMFNQLEEYVFPAPSSSSQPDSPTSVSTLNQDAQNSIKDEQQDPEIESKDVEATTVEIELPEFEVDDSQPEQNKLQNDLVEVLPQIQEEPSELALDAETSASEKVPDELSEYTTEMPEQMESSKLEQPVKTAVEPEAAAAAAAAPPPPPPPPPPPLLFS